MASASHQLLSCTKQRIGVLRSSKEVNFVHLSSKNDFFCKKSQTHENLSSALQKKMLISLERNYFSCSELCS